MGKSSNLRSGAERKIQMRGWGLGPEGSMWGTVGEEAVRGGGGEERKRSKTTGVSGSERIRHVYRGERCEGATAPARKPLWVVWT